MKGIYFFTLMLFITSVMYGQKSYTLKGKVLGNHGAPIENASVFITKTNKGVYTNTNGEFSLSAIKNSKIDIVISKVGYYKLKQTVSLLSEVTTRNFVLKVKTEDLNEVVVDASLQMHKNKMSVTSNRLGAKPIDMPNSSDVIGKALLEEQQVLTLGEAMQNVSGIYQFNQGYGGVSETFGARGLSQRYLGFMFRDGIRFGTNQYLSVPEIQAFEKVEVLKGGSAINFGQISPGATINYVTKKPFFETKGSVALRYGSYDFIKPILDVNFKLSDKLAFRYVSTAEIANSFRETVKSRRYFNYAAFRYLASENTTIDLNLEHLKDERPFDFGLPIFEDRIITGYTTNGGETTPVYLQQSGRQRLYSKITKDLRGRFLGSPFNNRTANQFNSNLIVNSKLNENWNFRFVGGASISEYDFVRTGSGFYNKYELEGDDIKITRMLEKQAMQEDVFGMQANLTGDFAVLGMKNKMSFSVDYDNRNQQTDFYAPVPNFDVIYLFNQNTPQRELIDQDKTYLGDSRYQGFGVAVQNLLSITEQLNLLASVRMDVIDGNTKNTYLQDYRGNSQGDVVNREYDDIAFTPAVGLTYKFTDSNAIFASYTNSFNPNSRFRLGEDDQILPSFFTNQFEIGTKNSFLKDKITTNATYFIINDNGYITSPTRPERFVIGPGTKIRGLEFDFSTTPVDGLLISANYTYTDAKYGAGGFFKEGTRPQQTPMHQLGFWSQYKFNRGVLKNFSVNLGGQYTGERLGNDFYRGNNPYVQEAYMLLNTGVTYQYKAFDVNLRVSNLLDEFTFFAYRYGSVNPIAPRQFSIVTRYKF
ncbi:TonB-dependent receptor domain-containing protein [Tenacibaculum xiamenense]|uniref:TonB-dependent receptor domain-containing protein n=1 Tax=Tenacibaculum xiamenense TaxID=1261553 RepID=UPI0038952504